LDAYNDADGYVNVFPDSLVRNDRSFALACAQKCLNFLDTFPHWLEDNSFAVDVLSVVPRPLALDWDTILPRLSACSWFGSAFILKVISANQGCGAGLAPSITEPDVAITICQRMHDLREDDSPSKSSPICFFFRALPNVVKRTIWRELLDLEPWVVCHCPEGTITQAESHLVQQLLSQTPMLLCSLPQALQEDLACARAAFVKDGLLLGADTLQMIWSDVREAVFLAVRQNGMALEYASRRWQDQEDIVEVALRQNGLALAYASQRLRHQESVVAIAVKQNPFAISFSRGCSSLDVQAREQPMPSRAQTQSAGFYPVHVF